jgi:hypothetical protein
LVDEAIPREAAVVEDIVVGFEDPVREPVVPHELPDVFDRVELGTLLWEREQGYIGGHSERAGAMPSRLIEEQDRVRTRCNGGGDFGQVQGHPLGIAAWQYKGCSLAFGGADRSVNISRCRPLVFGR